MNETDVYSAMADGDLLAIVYDKPQPLVQKPVCIACDDTGKNSNGGDCVPCTLRKRNETCRK